MSVVVCVAVCIAVCFAMFVSVCAQKRGQGSCVSMSVVVCVAVCVAVCVMRYILRCSICVCVSPAQCVQSCTEA